MQRGNGIHLDDQLLNRLREHARVRGISEQVVLKEAVEQYLDSHSGKSFLDRLNEAGLLGCADDLPPDLSTNKAYFEGFGRD